jgi:trypsin
MHRFVGTLAAAILLVLGASGSASAAGWKVGEPAPRTPDARIVNGTPAPDVVPWQVALVQLDANGSTALPLQVYCGGTLIAPDKVVTAAHCLPDHPGDDPEEIGVVSGLYRTSDPALTGAVLSGVTTVTSHPSYRQTSGGFDAAVLTLDGPLTQSERIQTRPVAPANGGAFTDAIAMISGWGTTSSGGSPPDDLLYTTISVYPDSNCSGYGESFITQTMVCAGFVDGTTVYDTCQGDSGGPLMRYDGPGTAFADFTTLIGIVSFGRGCAEAEFPGIYSRVTEPSINALITATTPAARVRRAGDPDISAAGGTITCTAAGWGNGPTSIEPTILLLTGTVEGSTLNVTRVEEKPGRTYATTAADNGKFAQCEERATNAGGSLTQTSGIISAPPAAAPVAPAPTPIPPAPGGGTGAGTGAPTGPITTPTDVLAPTSAITRRSCAGTRVCSLTVKLSDTGGADLSKARVRATVTQLTGCPKGRGKKARACRKPRSATVKAAGTGLFTVRTPKMRKGRVRIAVRATDGAGNQQAKAATVTLTVR